MHIMTPPDVLIGLHCATAGSCKHHTPHHQGRRSQADVLPCDSSCVLPSPPDPLMPGFWSALQLRLRGPTRCKPGRGSFWLLLLHVVGTHRRLGAEDIYICLRIMFEMRGGGFIILSKRSRLLGCCWCVHPLLFFSSLFSHSSLGFAGSGVVAGREIVDKKPSVLHFSSSA